MNTLEAAYRLNIREIWAALKREPLYFWFFCAYLFFEYVRPQGIYPAIDVLPWSRLSILGTLFLYFLSQKDSKSLGSPMTFSYVGFFAVAYLSAFFAVFPEEAFRQHTILLNWLLLYVVFIWVVSTRFRFYIVMLLLILASYKMSQHGIRVWASRGFSFAGHGINGPPGFFTNAADLGVQMAIFTPWALAFYLGCKHYWSSKWVKLLFIMAPISAIATALGTGQRNTAVAFIAMALCFVFFMKHRFRNITIISIAFVTILAVMPEEYKARFDTAGEDETSQSRLRYWGRGIEIYKEYPVLGVGFNNWVIYVSTYYPGESLRENVGMQEVAHSTPITLAAEMGTLGLIFYYSVVLVTLLLNKRSANYYASDPCPLWRYYALSLNFGLIGFLAASVFLSITYYPFLWVQASLSAALYKIMQSEKAALKS